MNFEKIVKLLQALNKDDIKRLESYIHSPYFNVGTAPAALFDYLADLHPDFPEKKLEPVPIARKMKSLPTLATQRTAGTRLLKSIEHFIALEDWQSIETNVSWHQFHAMQQLQLMDTFSSEFTKEVSKIDTDPEQDIDTFFNRHRFTELASNSFDSRLNRTQRNDILPTLKTLEEFYALKLLRYLCEALNRKQVLGTVYDEKHMASVLKTLEPYTNENHPYVYLFVNVYQMLATDTYERSEVYYNLIKRFVGAQSAETLPVSSIESMSYAVNWCLKWIGKGYDGPVGEYLWWTELKIKYSLLLESGKLLPITFRNIVTSAFFNNQEPEWMLRFIKQYSQCLPIEHRDTNIAFAQGLYYYLLKDYTKAIQSFLMAQAKDDIIFNAMIRRWQYMSTYEQNPSDTDLLLNQLNSFEKYITRNQDAFHQLKVPFLSFIKYAGKVLQLVDKQERIKVKDILEDEGFFPGKPWLLQKLEFHK
ncbi:MAG: hypothetical protein V4615_03730 [Bacteroidota bacterium]